MLIKKTVQGYSVSTGKKWIPLPDNIKTRTDLNQNYNDAYFKNSGDCLVYATDDHKPAKRYDIFFLNEYPMARVDENQTNFLVINLPKNASDESITEWLKNHARSENKEALINFTTQRPEPPEEE